MPKPVKIVLVLVLLLAGADATRDYLIARGGADSTGRTGEIISFWLFVAISLALAAYLGYRRFRSRR